MHKKGVLHRDISVYNLLLDAGLNVKLCDFQGRLLARNGKAEETGCSMECTKSYMPREDYNYADWKTDIFAFASTAYYIMEGHELYPDLHSFREE